MTFSQIIRVSLAIILIGALSACGHREAALDTDKAKEKEPQKTIIQNHKSPVLNHKINVVLVPDQNKLFAVDTITIPADLAHDGLRFMLNADLKLNSSVKQLSFKKVAENKCADDLGMDRDNARADCVIRVNVYELSGFTPGQDNEMTFSFTGVINNPVKALGAEYARGFSTSPGLIEERGAYLSGATYWVPTVKDTLVTYNMRVSSPTDWSSVSQGRLTLDEVEGTHHQDRWIVTTPTEEIYVIAAKFTRYQKQHGKVTNMAYLRKPDAALANKYLGVTGQYMDMYSELIGPYPYSKFALVENFWETGYGMPSFTLLGPQVIRFPWILHSSYPHELLHNWWGNSVYIDFDTGNWAEGLTAYMADHLIAEQRGQGAAWRRATLQRYTSYVNPSNDFPLRKFIGRTDGPTEAVGYGKTAMVFDMLREKVGDKHFKRALHHFYNDHKFSVGTWDQIRAAFEEVSGADLSDFFHQWVDGIGAPELAIEKAAQEGDKLTLMLKQTQEHTPFTLDIPVAIYTRDAVRTARVHMDTRQQVFSIPVSGHVVRVEVDPQFNVFRRLHWAEIPPSLGAAFGADKVVIVLPTRTRPALVERYTRLAALWSGRDNVSIVKDSDISDIPNDAAVWIFGQNNKFFGLIKHRLKDYQAAVDKDNLTVGGKSLSLRDNSTILVVRHPKNPELPIVGLTAHSDKAVAGLARKLPHYGKYSYLAFDGDAPTNTAKGQWPAVGSPLIAVLDRTVSSTVKLKPRKALAYLKPDFDTKAMMESIKTLSSKAYDGRGVGTKGLEMAGEYIAKAFAKAGLKPGADDGSYFQSFTMNGPDGKPVSVRNVIGIIPGKNPKFKGQSVVVSAHYDHLGYGWPGVRAAFKGKMHPGADDNASGIAVLIALAQNLSGSAPERTIVFLAPSGEEAGLLGARHYVKAAKTYPAGKIFANVNLDTVGRAGKKIMVFGGSSAREWPFIFMGTKATTGIDTDLVKQAVNASDHTAFLEAGIPAIHIFGSPTSDYHRPSDTADKIDPGSLMRVATLTREVVEYLAGRPEPMTNQIKPDRGEKVLPPAGKNSGRKVATGAVPDFTYSGKGVRVMDVRENSSGAKAGLKPGDIITKFGGHAITDLRVYSNTLKTYRPGDKVEITVLRDGKPLTLHLVLAAR